MVIVDFRGHGGLAGPLGRFAPGLVVRGNLPKATPTFNLRITLRVLLDS